MFHHKINCWKKKNWQFGVFTNTRKHFVDNCVSLYWRVQQEILEFSIVLISRNKTKTSVKPSCYKLKLYYNFQRNETMYLMARLYYTVSFPPEGHLFSCHFLRVETKNCLGLCLISYEMNYIFFYLIWTVYIGGRQNDLGIGPGGFLMNPL